MSWQNYLQLCESNLSSTQIMYLISLYLCFNESTRKGKRVQVQDEGSRIQTQFLKIDVNFPQ
jgi:Trp operon repressor